MSITEVISLTQQLISYNTINPPGNEQAIAEFVGEILSSNGFNVKLTEFQDKSRLHLMAEKCLNESSSPVVLSGHFDTVPLGNAVWSIDPFTGIIKKNKIYGRGSSDMKSGIAVMIAAAINVSKKFYKGSGIRIILTAGEEMGCEGVRHLIQTSNNFGSASAILIAEPTANLPAIGHKGALFLKVVAKGITAHSSEPELGDNAIYKVSRAIGKIEKFRFDVEEDKLLGFPTINVGMINGGMNINSVPDIAEFTIDVRTTTKAFNQQILSEITSLLGSEVDIQILVNENPVFTDESHPFVNKVCKACSINPGNLWKKSMPYLTDGSILQPFYNNVPTIILGPGQPEMAHKTDEFCYLSKIEEALKIYEYVLLN